MATLPLITDPLDWAVDPLTGELALDASGSPYFAVGLAGAAQLVRQAVLSFMGEWFADLLSGVPWLANDTVPASQAILAERYDEVRARAALRSAVLGVVVVRSITRLELAFDAASRHLAVTVEAATIWGDTVAVSLSGVP